MAMIGIVKWFNNAKGYGFICPEDGSQDIFAHFSSIIMDGYKCLRAGQAVSFEIFDGPKGLHASAITPLAEKTTVEIKNSIEEFEEEMV